jgi:hypothetical protein
MAWTDDLETVIGRTKHERYRVLTADDHPDHEIWRQRVTEMATGEPAPVSYPSTAAMAVSLWRAIKAFVASGGKVAPKAVRAHRQATCDVCPHYRRVDKRCGKCGCYSLKLYSAAEVCPDKPPRWLAVTPAVRSQAPSPGPVDPSS